LTASQLFCIVIKKHYVIIMITVQKVTGIELTPSLHISSYFFWHRKKPLLAPTLFALSESMRGASENTVRSYKDRLRTFFTALEDWKGVDQWNALTDRDISAYVHSYLIQEKGLKRKSVENHTAALNRFYRFSRSIGLIENIPNFEINLSNFDFKTSTLSADSIAKLRETHISEDDFQNTVLPASQLISKSTFTRQRAELVLMLGYYAGLRAREIIDPRNLDTTVLEAKLNARSTLNAAIEIEIIGKGEKLRTVPCPPRLVSSISKFINGERGKLPPGPLICKKNGSWLGSSDQLPSDVFAFCRSKILSTEGRSDIAWGRSRFHTLRKCYATNLVSWSYENGFDPWVIVPEYMGHTDKQTTFIYVFFDAVMNQRNNILKKLAGNDRKLPPFNNQYK